MDSDHLVERILHVQRACGYGSSHEQLALLLATWLVQASVVRTEALIEPGGFQAARDRQADRLRWCADMIAADTPDVEMKRLYQEGNITGMLRHAQQQIDGVQNGDPQPPEE